MNLPKTQQGNVVFKTEEERMQALNSVPIDPPLELGDKSLDQWRQEQDAIQDQIESATIDPNAQIIDVQGGENGDVSRSTPGQDPTPHQNNQTAADTSGWYKPDDWTFQRDGQAVTVPEDEIPESLRGKSIKDSESLLHEVVNSKRYLDTKTEEYNRSLSSLNQQMEDMKKRLESAEKKTKEQVESGSPPSPADPKPDIPSDSEIGNVQSELDNINQQIDSMDEDDPEANSLTRKALRLSNKLNTMRNKVHDARYQQFKAEQDRVRQDAENARKLREDQDLARRQEQEAEQAKAEMHTSIEGFAKSHNELKLSKSFREIENEYDNWATDVAATHFGIAPNQVTTKHAEMAVNAYLNKTPVLMQKLTEQGKLNREPTDLRKYLMHTELYLMTKGMELDPSTGEFVQHKWSLPDMETAFERFKRKKGLQYQEVVEAANKAEEELLKVMNPPKVAEQVPADQGPSAQRDMSKLSKEQAATLLNDLENQAKQNNFLDLEEWIETLRRRNSEDDRIKQYDRAFEALYAEQEVN